MRGLILAGTQQCGLVAYDAIPDCAQSAPAKPRTDWAGFLIALIPWALFGFVWWTLQ